MKGLPLLRQVLDTLGQLQTILDGEVARGHAQTTALIGLDAAAAGGYARRRVAFSAEVATLQVELAARVATAASAMGAVTFEPAEIERLHPVEGQRLRAALAALRRSTAEIQRQDALNHLLATRARACVTSWLRALTSLPSAYDRQGAARGLPSFNTAAKVA